MCPSTNNPEEFGLLNLRIVHCYTQICGLAEAWGLHKGMHILFMKLSRQEMHIGQCKQLSTEMRYLKGGKGVI